MQVAAILPIFALLAATLAAQAPLAKPGSVEGVVTNSVTNEPVKKAAVTLGGKYTVTTDASGHFLFDDVAPGSYVLSAERDGFQPTNLGRGQLLLMATVAEDQHLQNAALKLVPLGAVRGHVLDEDGDPIVRAMVIVFKYSYGPGRKRLTQVTNASTNDLGEFEVINLPPGRYYFQAVAHPLPLIIPARTRWTHGEQAYPAIFYPNALEIGQATATDVAPGAHVNNIDIRLRKMPAYHVRGTVIGATGGQAEHAGQVVVQGPESSFGVNVGQLKSDGTFDVRGVVSGSYEVSYSQFASPQVSYSAQSVHVSDSDVNAVVIARKPQVDLSGTVIVEGAPPAELYLQIFLLSLKVWSGALNSAIGADGTFMITAAPAEVSQLQIKNVPAGKYVKSIHYGDREIKNGEIDLSGGASGPLTIVLGADGGEVDGNVQNSSGQPAANAQVTLAAAEENEDSFVRHKSVETDAAGNFQIKDVAPGDYRVFGWESDPDGSTQSAEFRKPFEAKSVVVTVGLKEKVAVQLSVITDGDIEKARSKLP